MEKIVLLLSGGLDSSVLFALLNKQNVKVLPLFIDYGQRNKKQELKAATYISKLFDCRLNKIKIAPPFKDSLLIKGSSSQSAFLPHRNLLFLVIAAIYAFNNRCNAIAIAIHAGTDYPDSTESFVQEASKSIAESIGEKMIIYAPFVTKNKVDIALLAHLLKLPVGKTYSCYVGKRNHCRRCGACIQRFDSLKEVEKFVQNHI
jgi:7-cyano-7-deazaguanine synthase